MFLPAFALLPLIADIRDMHCFSFFLRALCVCMSLSLSRIIIITKNTKLTLFALLCVHILLSMRFIRGYRPN